MSPMPLSQVALAHHKTVGILPMGSISSVFINKINMAKKVTCKSLALLRILCRLDINLLAITISPLLQGMWESKASKTKDG